MTGIFEITIKGKKERLKFNNYSTMELENYLMPKGKISLDKDELSLIIADRWEENKLLLTKNLIWAGLVGHYYIHQDACPYTKLEIGEYVADAPYDELFPILEVWLKANQDPTDSEEEAEEAEETEKKKKQTS